MKTLIAYYSKSGTTKKYAGILAAELGADIIDLKQLKQEKKDVATAMEPYEKLVIAGPIWAGSPAPLAKKAIKAVPPGKEVEFVFTSGSGSSGKSAEKLGAEVVRRGSKFTGSKDFSSQQVKDM